LSQRKIARKPGISRNTVKKKYLGNPELPGDQRRIRKRKSLLDAYRDNVKAWLKEDMDYRATWIYDRLNAIGFSVMSDN